MIAVGMQNDSYGPDADDTFTRIEKRDRIIAQAAIAATDLRSQLADRDTAIAELLAVLKEAMQGQPICTYGGMEKCREAIRRGRPGAGRICLGCRAAEVYAKHKKEPTK